MNISAKTIERLVDIITGNSEKSPYRSGPLLLAGQRFGLDSL